MGEEDSIPLSPAPSQPALRSQWVRALRPPITRPDAKAQANTLIEQEWTIEGNPIQTAVVFLINRECPWNCVMCDLWQHTTPNTLPPGHAVLQLKNALKKIAASSPQPVERIKLYNSGSFFDRRAIHPQDYQAIADALQGFDSVVVESHPRLIDQRVGEFARRLKPSLEVAMGLECADDTVLRQLNKRFQLKDYEEAANRLKHDGIAHRAFIMIQPPFVDPAQAQQSCMKTITYALDQGAAQLSLIPARPGAGALEALQAQGAFSPPTMHTIERCFEEGLNQAQGRLHIDTWDLHTFNPCPTCNQSRVDRLTQMNRLQTMLPAIHCPSCS